MKKLHEETRRGLSCYTIRHKTLYARLKRLAGQRGNDEQNFSPGLRAPPLPVPVFPTGSFPLNKVQTKQRPPDRIALPLENPDAAKFIVFEDVHVRFQVCGTATGGIPLDEVSSILAIYCLRTGRPLSSFGIARVEPESEWLRITARAESLIQSGFALGNPVKISNREQQVLDGVLSALQNKEIAANLNISERTVKFHVSSLLAKFGVLNRLELAKMIHARG